MCVGDARAFSFSLSFCSRQALARFLHFLSFFRSVFLPAFLHLELWGGGVVVYSGRSDLCWEFFSGAEEEDACRIGLR